MKYLIALAWIVGFAAVLRICLYLGERWVDRMLYFSPIDPSKPIVRRHPAGDQ